MNTESLIGKTLVCHETGKEFIGAVMGCTTNYARDSAGNVYSDEGVDVSQKRELLDRTKPFTAYISGNGKHMTGWKGNNLGVVIWDSKVRLTRWSFWHGQYMHAYRIRDIHGGVWYGRGGPGMAINIRPMKQK